MLRRAIVPSLVLLLASCSLVPSSTPSTPTTPSTPSTLDERTELLSAKTATVILRARGEAPAAEARIVAIWCDDAPRGLARTWRISLGSIDRNVLVTYEVGIDGVVGTPEEEPYNPVFDDRSPPFLEEHWTLDSTDAARTLPEPEDARLFFLEADDTGQLQWTIRTVSGERYDVESGEATLETPPPSWTIRGRRR